MNATRHIDQDDLALFAMQLLPEGESALIAAHLEQCAECRAQLAELQGDLALYAHTVDMHSPPAQARERLMSQVSREKKAIPINRAASVASADSASHATADTEAEPSFGRRSFLGADEDDQPAPSLAGKVFPWIGWAIAAGLAVAAGNLYHQRDTLRSLVVAQAGRVDRLATDAAAARQVMDAMTDSSAMRVTLSKGLTPPTPQGRATYVASKGTLVFIANNLEPLQPAKVYELWLIPADGHDPIPAGTFRPDDRGNASVILPPLPKGIAAKAFGVTIEDEGGSQTPTLPIIMAGT